MMRGVTLRYFLGEKIRKWSIARS